MTIAYDLVVIGGIDGFSHSNAYTLASRAASRGARVALVTNWELINSARAAQIAVQILAHSQTGQSLSEKSLPNLLDRLDLNYNPYEQLEALQIQGVDVVLGNGRFSDRQTLVVTEASNSKVQVKSNSTSTARSTTERKPRDRPSNPRNQRLIKARNFAIAWTQLPHLRKIVGLATVDYLNCDRLWQLPELPRSIAIIGGDAQSCTIAQALSRLGCRVTMLVAETHVLGDRVTTHTDQLNSDLQTDVEVARLLQAYLEISHLEAQTAKSTAIAPVEPTKHQPEPIEIYTAHRVTAVAMHQKAAKIRIWAGDRTFDCEHLLIPGLANAANQLLLNLDLAKAGVNIGSGGSSLGANGSGNLNLSLNTKCQTSNRRIYVCRSTASIEVILQNSLFLPTAKLRDYPLAQLTATQPAIATLGMSEMSARLSYGKDLLVLRLTLPELALQGQNLAAPGLLKILCRPNGQIVGVHGLGSQAIGMIPALAIAMTQKISLNQLATLRQVLPDRITSQSHAQSTDRSLNWLAMAIDQFEHQQRQRQGNWREWLERWFMWRRDYDL
jgi:pyruvate/2-oxoglutarate dehydrogenase complex dihydrolipoamide dehydrogenase (E3) component